MIVPGLGGFAPTFGSGLTATAPAAAPQGLAAGGIAGLSPQQGMQWARLLKTRRLGAYRTGGRVRQRLEDGGDAGDGGDGAEGGTDAGDTGGFGGAGVDAGIGGLGGFNDNTGVDVAGGGFNDIGGSPLGADPNSAFDQAGIDPSAADDPSMGQVMAAGLKAGLMGAVPGLGMVNSLAGNPMGKGLGALGLGQMSPGASFGSGVMGSIGGALGGPVGAMAGAAIGSVMGAHGGSGPGMGGSGASAGTNGIGTSMAGQGGYSAGPTSNAGSTSNTTGYDPSAAPPATAQPDIGDLIQRIRAAMDQRTGAPAMGYARGGPVRGRSGAHRGFHRGSGLVPGASDGRADAIDDTVPAGSYVLPADVVSGLGQGNTMAGARKMAGMMPQQPGRYAAGGTVPVKLSAGEFVIHPAHVAAMGGGDLKAGSNKLDEMVGHVRRISAAQVAGMPPPR